MERNTRTIPTEHQGKHNQLLLAPKEQGARHMPSSNNCISVFACYLRNIIGPVGIGNDGGIGSFHGGGFTGGNGFGGLNGGSGFSGSRHFQPSGIFGGGFLTGGFTMGGRLKQSLGNFLQIAIGTATHAGVARQMQAAQPTTKPPHTTFP